MRIVPLLAVLLTALPAAADDRPFLPFAAVDYVATFVVLMRLPYRPDYIETVTHHDGLTRIDRGNQARYYGPPGSARVVVTRDEAGVLAGLRIHSSRPSMEPYYWREPGSVEWDDASIKTDERQVVLGEPAMSGS